MTARPRRALKLVGETVREIGLLWAVFAPLDAFFAEKAPVAANVWVFTLFGLTLTVVGINMELAAEEDSR